MNVNVKIRRGTDEDAEGCNELLFEAASDLGARHGTPLPGTAAEWWQATEGLHRYLSREAAEWWVAEAADGRLIGYARSIEREGLFELTELFVRPTAQSRGVGKELMERAFPLGRGDVRLIVATTDVRALARYYAADTVARFPIFTLTGEPWPVETGDLSMEALTGDRSGLNNVVEIERAVTGYGRTDAELAWLLENREGYLYRLGDRTVGFAFVGLLGAGPVVAVEPDHLPGILLHVEGRAKALGLEQLGFEVPAVNAVAIEHLRRRGFRLDPWINLLMSNKPFGQFDRFIGFSPPLFL